ncbi:hypothetical protein DPMN_022517 [Dreissena polymorpha]|uniref:Uncharacterized protein n=1 Tax=Dreissena polymorpha TaxID=45954 RepID=A0A9D4NKH7_DREPO|nr:hypothetical protein DPMN_022517 [Dreissena polymorpha]
MWILMSVSSRQNMVARCYNLSLSQVSLSIMMSELSSEKSSQNALNFDSLFEHLVLFAQAIFMRLQGDELIFGDPIYVSMDDMLLLDWIVEASDSEYGSLNTLN